MNRHLIDEDLWREQAERLNHRLRDATLFFTPNGSGSDDCVPWLGRNSAKTTGFAVLDFRVTREVRFGETTKVVFAWEASNLFNRTNLVYSIFGDDAFNVVGSCITSGARVIRVAPRSGFPNPTAASNTLSGQRKMQFAFKFIW